MILDSERRLRAGWRVALYLVVTTAAFLLVQVLVLPTAARMGLPAQIGGWLYLLVAVPIVMLMTRWFRRHLDRRPWAPVGLSWTRPARVAIDTAIGAAAGTAAAAALLAGYVAGGHHAIIGPTPDRGLAETVGSAAAGLGLPLALALTEELQYRGYVFANLAERTRPWTAAVASSILFAPMHLLVNPPELIGTAALMGMLLAALRMASGALWLPIGFHTTYNWAHWQLFPDGPLPPWLAVVDAPYSPGQVPSVAIQYAFHLIILLVVLALLHRRLRHASRPGSPTSLPFTLQEPRPPREEPAP